MSSATVACPECGKKLLPPAQTAPAQRVRCPTCGCTFLPFDPAAAVQPTPVPVWAEPVFQLPEALPVAEVAAPRPPVPARPPDGEPPQPPRKPAGCGTVFLVGVLLGGATLLAAGGGGLLALFWL